MLLGRKFASGEDWLREPEYQRGNEWRRGEGRRWFLENKRNDTAHGGDAIEGQTLAGLLRRFRLLLLHHLHAVSAHL